MDKVLKITILYFNISSMLSPLSIKSVHVGNVKQFDSACGLLGFISVYILCFDVEYYLIQHQYVRSGLNKNSSILFANTNNDQEDLKN